MGVQFQEGYVNLINTHTAARWPPYRAYYGSIKMTAEDAVKNGANDIEKNSASLR